MFKSLPIGIFLVITFFTFLVVDKNFLQSQKYSTEIKAALALSDEIYGCERSTKNGVDSCSAILCRNSNRKACFDKTEYIKGTGALGIKAIGDTLYVVSKGTEIKTEAKWNYTNTFEIKLVFLAVIAIVFFISLRFKERIKCYKRHPDLTKLFVSLNLSFLFLSTYGFIESNLEIKATKVAEELPLSLGINKFITSEIKSVVFTGHSKGGNEAFFLYRNFDYKNVNKKLITFSSGYHIDKSEKLKDQIHIASGLDLIGWFINPSLDNPKGFLSLPGFYVNLLMFFLIFLLYMIQTTRKSVRYVFVMFIPIIFAAYFWFFHSIYLCEYFIL